MIGALTPLITTADSSLLPPSVPDTGTASTQEFSVEEALPTPTAPVRIIIPAIGVNDVVQGVGVDSTGAMAVPSGATKNVGWYEDGVVPGGVGSAVMDAHVFAAFSKLHDVKAGDDIYVQTDSGQTLHFVVTATKTYALSSLSALSLFRPTNSRDLNLITCAGNLTPDHSTYDHRLIVYATLVS